MSKIIESSFPAVNRIHSGFHFDLLARIAHRSQRTGYTAWSYDVGGHRVNESTGMCCQRSRRANGGGGYRWGERRLASVCGEESVEVA